jgi:hypothetical protein
VKINTDNPTADSDSVAILIPVAWAESDLAILETDPLTPGKTPTQPAISVTDYRVRPAGGLPPGARAGIGVAAALLGLGLIIATVLFVRRYRRRRLATSGLEQDTREPDDEKPNPDAKVVAIPRSGAEATNILELDTERGTHVLAELPVVETPAADPVISASRPPRLGSDELYSTLPEVVSATPSTQAYSAPSSSQPLSNPYPASAADAREIREAGGPANANVAEDHELRLLMERQAEIAAQKDRLLQIQKLEEEDGQIRRRISELSRARSP